MHMYVYEYIEAMSHSSIYFEKKTSGWDAGVGDIGRKRQWKINGRKN